LVIRDAAVGVFAVFFSAGWVLAMRVSSLGRFAALLASTALSTPGFALEPSGSAVRVDRIANAQGAAGERVLEVDGDVFMGDEITTNSYGIAQIRFVDDTRIVVGPNSKLVIDSFVFNPDNTARQVTVDAVKGVFRFISGRSPHEAYSIRTPTMTIGVRGTVVDINARGPDSSVMFISGSGSACDAGGSCININDPCDLWVAPRGGGFAESTGVDRTLRVSAFFPFVGDQSALDPIFRTNVGNCENANSVVIPQIIPNDSPDLLPPPPPFVAPLAAPPPPYGGNDA
jgi:hypothetical protein